MERLSDAERATIAFERLHYLAQRGYVPELWSNERSSIRLEHPSERAAHPWLVLCPSGALWGGGPNRWWCEAEDAQEFAGFLRSVPLPNIWERTRFAREKIKAFAFMTALFAAAAGVLGYAAGAAINGVRAILQQFAFL